MPSCGEADLQMESDSNKRKRVSNHAGNKDSREDDVVEDAADPQGDNAPLVSPNTTVRVSSELYNASEADAPER